MSEETRACIRRQTAREIAERLRAGDTPVESAEGLARWLEEEYLDKEGGA